MDVILPPMPGCLPDLRRGAERELRGVAGDVADDVLLALDEAVGNAIRHGPTAELPCLPAGPPPTLADGGRGLWLISQLVDEVRLERAGRGVLLSLRRRAESRVAAGA